MRRSSPWPARSSIETVAEGVETLEQQTFLRNHGCDQAQGFLYSRPVPPDEVVALVRKPSLGLHVAGPAAMFDASSSPLSAALDVPSLPTSR